LVHVLNWLSVPTGISSEEHSKVDYASRSLERN
jgi:hypothetical protein